MMQSILDAPVTAVDLQQPPGVRLFGRQTGNPKNRFFTHLASIDLSKAPLKLEDLPSIGPIQFACLNTTHRQRTSFKTAMPLVGDTDPPQFQLANQKVNPELEPFRHPFRPIFASQLGKDHHDQQ